MSNRILTLPAALIALGLAATAPAQAGTAGVLDGVWAQFAGAGHPEFVAEMAEAEFLLAQANPEAGAPDQPAPGAGPEADAEEAAAPEAEAENGERSLDMRMRPTVKWVDRNDLVVCHPGVFCDRPGVFERGDLDARLSAARDRLDDSDRFPEGPIRGWRYDPETRTYHYFSQGRWHRAGRAQGYYDRHGNWHPDGWRDGRWRTGPAPRPRDPCDCDGW